MDWHYLETKLKGGKVATVNVANLPYVDMQSKTWGKDARQLWRIKVQSFLLHLILNLFSGKWLP